ncbi:MAG: hypothetical protein ACREE5_13960 [Acetobacteraceae bacterium]
MKERRTRQPGQFHPVNSPVELPKMRRVGTLVLLVVLLIEAIAVQGGATVIQPREVGDDQDHG